MQEADAARRLAILRGETPPPLPEPEPEIDPSSSKFAQRDKTSTSGFSQRKRKRAGEDDTDFEMRAARERAEMGEQVAAELAGNKRKKLADVNIVGRDGHIDLIGAVPSLDEKNAEYEQEAARKKREAEDQYTMRFSNAAGRDGLAAGDPWYSKPDKRQGASASKEERDMQLAVEAPRTNVWGRDDPKRRDREALRLTSSDPLAMMKMGAKKVREVDRERRKAAEERARELEDLQKEDRRREKRRRKDDREENGNGHRSDHARRRRSRHRDDDRGEQRERRRRSNERHRDTERHSGRSTESHHRRSHAHY